jgi:hypothetical protein
MLPAVWENSIAPGGPMGVRIQSAKMTTKRYCIPASNILVKSQSCQ